MGRTSNRLRLFSAYLRRKARVKSLPVSLIIETTSYCNLKCPMCPRQQTDYPGANMDPLLFERIVDEVRGESGLIFPWGLGEPLMNPDIFRMIRYCSREGLYTVVSTNATLLTREKGRELILSGLDNLIIAFDGTTAETYEKYRVNADYEKVMANILAFLELKKEMGSRMNVVMQMVRLPGNTHQVDEYRRIWNREGVDEVRIKEDEVIVEGVAFEGRSRQRVQRNPCYQLWQGPVHIDYKGDFRPCCYLFEDEPIGNVSEQSIRELWDSEAMQSLRQAHLEGNLSEYPGCRACFAPNPRYPVIAGSFLVNPEVLRRWIPKAEKLALLHRLPFFRDR